MSKSKMEKLPKIHPLSGREHLFQKQFKNPDLVGADAANQFQKNRLAELIKQKFGARNYSPTDEQLDQLGLTRNMFTRILENKSEPGFGEALRIASWLDVSVDELYLV